MTILQSILFASRTIARRDAETLLLHVLGRDRAWLLARPDAELSSLDSQRFLDLAARRADHVPLQYLTGRQEFFGLALEVGPAVLIPRPETELLVEAVLAWLAEQQVAHPRIVDVGTGSGAIALALAANLPGASLIAVDVSVAALAVAAANAERLGLQVQFLPSDLLQALAPGTPACLDVVVSNPPYVPQGDAPEMQPEVRDHEPHLALFAGEEGLTMYERLLPQAYAALRPGGLLALEIGFGQKAALTRLLGAWNAVRFDEDYAGIPRVALAVRPPSWR